MILEEEISPIELSEIDRIISDCVTSSNEIKSTRIGLFEDMIKKKIIPVDDAFPIAIKEIKTLLDIGIIIICLKHGANRNLYVNVKGLGPAHILLYCFHVHFKERRKVFEFLYNIIVLEGGTTMITSYENNSIINPYIKNKSTNGSRIKMESVFEWLVHHGKGDFKLPSVASEIIAYINSDRVTEYDKAIYSVYLNDTNISEWTIDMLPFLLSSRNHCWNKIKDRTKKSIYLKIAFASTFSNLVIEMLNDNIKLSYIDITFLIAHYRHIMKLEQEYLKNQCEIVFIELVKRGYKFDLYCIDEIGFINSKFRDLLLDEYQKPLYSKVCSYRNDNFIPDELKNVAVYLGLPDDSDKNVICNSIEIITTADLESLIKANQKRNTQAIGSKLNFLTDFINSNGNSGCDNKSYFNDNPLDYPNSLLAYYKDDDNKKWCFLSKDFDKLIHTKINPINKSVLPKNFIEILKSQTNRLNTLGIPLSEPKTLARVIEDIKGNDIPNNIKTDSIIDSVNLVLSSNGLTKNELLNVIKIEDIIERFDRIDVNIIEILLLSEDDFEKKFNDISEGFSPNMIYVILCNILDEKFKEDVSLINIFLKS